MTWSAWVKAAANPADDGQIIAKSNDAGGWQFKTSPDTGPHTFGVAVTAISGFKAQRYSVTQRALNTWYYVAGVYDASGSTLNIYVNGVLDNGVLSGAVPASQFNQNVNVNIGRRTGGYYFNGIIDEVRIYNRALSPAEIQFDMNSPISGVSLPAISLSNTSITFNNQTVNTVSTPQTATLTNTGAATLEIGNIAVTGLDISDFLQTTNCGSLVAPNGSCTININFTPTAIGLRNAAVTIQDNAPGNPHTIGLSGTGITSGLSVSPREATLTFTRTQQFTSSSGAVIWLVDGVIGGSAALGTITGTGLYTPPRSVGLHTVTASGGSQSASANVYVTNNSGEFTYHNDNLRTGQNLNETVLTPANVNADRFGKLLSYPLDGLAYASPLYVANVNISGQGFYNVVYVATEHDSVYAFDADGLSSVPLWKVSFLGPGVTTVPATDTGGGDDIAFEVGITGTPVIDAASGTLYVVAKTKEGTTYVQRLHALDIASGAEKFGGPVVIQASVTGTGSGSQGGQVPFDALRENQRPALLLSNGVVYIGFASHADAAPYHGWVLGYDKATLQLVMRFNATPNALGAGIWMGGGGLSADADGNLYFTTGNGTFDVNTGGIDYGDTFLKISPSGNVLDYFTPHDQGIMDTGNWDLGSGAPSLLPDQGGLNPRLIVGAGKTGTVYLVNRDNMGHYNPSNDNQIVQSLVSAFPRGTPEPGNDSSPAYFNGVVYFSPISDTIQAFSITNGLLSTAPISRSSTVFAYPGGGMAISANGGSNGILWAVQRPTDSTPGVLRAYDATNLASELYNSSQAGSLDTLDVAAKFNCPIVVNGKVFITSRSQLTVYGLRP
jgi:hypothetical protein